MGYKMTSIKEFVEDEIIMEPALNIREQLLKLIDKQLNNLLKAYSGETSYHVIGLENKEPVKPLIDMFVDFRKKINTDYEHFKLLTAEDLEIYFTEMRKAFNLGDNYTCVNFIRDIMRR